MLFPFCFRLLRTQSLDWYYNNVKSRFKCFGSAKVLKNLYKKHRLESGVCPDVIGKSSCVHHNFNTRTEDNENSENLFPKRFCNVASFQKYQTRGNKEVKCLESHFNNVKNV